MSRFCQLLSENGYQIALICRHKGGMNEDQFPSDINFYQLSSTSFLIKLWEVFSILRDFKPDIVHLHYLSKDCIIPALKLNRKYKYYISIWGSDINTLSNNIINKIIQNLGLLLCDKFHLLSHYFENKIHKLFYFIKKDKYALFSWGVDFNSLTSPQHAYLDHIKNDFNISESDIIIMSYRNHKEIYNHHTLLKSSPLIIEEFPSSKLIFTRSSYSEEYIQKTFKLMHHLGVKDQIIFIDRWLSNNELYALINIADIHVNIPFKDGLPATLFEIMCTKAIPIISDLNNYHPFFKDKVNGFYLHILDDYKELSELIKMSLRKLDYYQQKFQITNNDYIRKYQNWNIQSKIFLNFYN